MSEKQTAEDLPLPGGDFRLLVTRLSFQGMMSLGILKNPLTGAKSADPKSARMIIDDLTMMREKTQGNLDKDETDHLNRVIEALEVGLENLKEEEGAPADS